MSLSFASSIWTYKITITGTSLGSSTILDTNDFLLYFSLLN